MAGYFMTILQQPVLDVPLRAPTIYLLFSVPPRLRGVILGPDHPITRDHGDLPAFLRVSVPPW
jgi:hypothetical protein